MKKSTVHSRQSTADYLLDKRFFIEDVLLPSFITFRPFTAVRINTSKPTDGIVDLKGLTSDVSRYQYLFRTPSINFSIARLTADAEAR